MQKFLVALTATLLLLSNQLSAQGVINPTDSVYNYNPAAPPAQPPYGQIGKWVRTPYLPWNTNEYKAYIYKGNAFRIHFPVGYNPTANDGKKYPIMVFFHGLGERASIYDSIYDNDHQLLNGGQLFQTAVDNGTFNGYLFYMQSEGFWGGSQYQFITELIDSMVANNKVDPFRVYVNGLSAGGQGAWEMMLNFPNYVTADAPMSNISIGYASSNIVNEVAFTPVWDFGGGLDGSPAPSTGAQVDAAMVAAGADYTYTLFTTQGHDTWDSAWALPNFWSYFLAAYSSNPWTLYGQTAFCPGTPINLTIGLAPGYDAYQWRMNGNVIAGATTNTINVTQVGVYDARVLRKGIWSDWSHTPVNVITQQPTVTPPIQVSGLMSTAIPGADGNNYVNLTVPNSSSYNSFTWEMAGSNTVLGTQPVFKATQPGYYIVSVTQQYGCSSNFSPAFKVINAKGVNPPPAATGLVANALSNTKIQLAWSANQHPLNAPTAFEIYRGTTSGGPYTFDAQVSPSTISFLDSNLTPKVNYYYVVRAIDSSAASPLSNQASAVTLSDTIAPSAPGTLTLVYSTPTTISIAWGAATDNVGVDHYNIYLNGVLTNSTKLTSFTLSALTANQSYTIYVKAADASGNISVQSNQLSASAVLGGLKYSVYTGSWSALPNFSTLTPVQTGISGNTNIGVTTLTTTFGMVWQGYIQIPVAGTYTFYTNSDDGSALWFNSLTATGTPTVNNDGLHGPQTVGSAALTLQPGIYPITIEYFQQGGGLTMSVLWSCSQLYGNTTAQAIPNSYFQTTAATVTPPAATTTPAGLTYSYYTTTTGWTALPNFSTLKAVSTGVMANPYVSNTSNPAPQSSNFGYLWQGYLQVPVSGTYTFYLASNDGSALWFNSYIPVGTATVNNDGIHGSGTYKSTTLTLQAGVYPVCMEFFRGAESGGSYTMFPTWACSALFGDNNPHAIANNYFVSGPTVPALPTLPTLGLAYSYYTTATAWSALPNFALLKPVSTGVLDTVNVSTAPATTNFGYQWQGYIRIPVAGTYTFTTNSDDGSALWFNSFTATGTPTVNNDGAHGPQSVSSTALSLQPGIYPICIEYFQAGGGYSMSVGWSCPQLFGNSNFYNITGNYWGSGTTAIVPAIPTNVAALATAYNKINVSWVDNSNNETGFEIYRSTSSGGPFNIIYTTAANATSYTDSSLNASTTYYYEVQAINNAGGSGLTSIASAKGLSYSFYQFTSISNLAAINSLTPVSSSTINNVTATAPNGATTNYAFKFSGLIKIPTTGTYTFYTTSDDGSDLYAGGFDSAHLIVKNDYAQGPTQRSGTVSLNAGVYPYYVTYYQAGGGFSLSTSWQGPGISQSAIPDSVLTIRSSYATTPALPAAPATPATFTASAVSSAKIALSWAAVANNAAGYQLQRSLSDSLHYVVLAKPSAATTSFTDSSLSAHTLSYYKINTSGAGGSSSNTVTAFATTKDNAPVIIKLATQYARYGTATLLAESATDADGDLLTFSVKNNPSFTSLVDSGNGHATLVVANATAANQGTYPNIKILVSDGYGGFDSTTFTLVVNSIYAPVINALSNITMNENDTLTLNLSAIDQNVGDTLTWSVSNIPSSFTLTPGGNNTAKLFLHPGYAAAGTYNVSVNATNGKSNVAAQQFILTVNYKNPNTNVYVRFMNQDAAPAPWNSVTGVTSNNFVDASGSTTNIGLSLQTTWFATYNNGPVTGNNSGVYPDAVLEDYYYFGIYGGPSTVSAQITGLDTTRSYNLSFYAGSVFGGVPNNGSTTYTIGSQTDTLYVQGNTQNVATFRSVKPVSGGTITFTMGVTSGTPVGYLNALVINSIYDDGTIPLAPSALTAQNGTGQAVQLSWTDLAYNATGYNIYRSLNASGPFTLAGTAQANAVSYTDTSGTGTTQYYYEVNAVNAHGASGFTNIASIITGDRIPAIAPINNVILTNVQQVTVNVSAKDDSTDHITLTAANLPSFATLQDNGNGTGTISINPANGNIGIYQNIIITATDKAGASSSSIFYITVKDQNVQSVYLNFSTGLLAPAPAPWNNLAGFPFAGTVFNNLTDDGNNATNITVTFKNGFAGVVSSGMQPVSGYGIYPNVVMRDGEYEASSNTDSIKISGLSTSLKYNFVFFSSHDDGLSSLTDFTINGQMVALNGTDNINKTVALNGIKPDSTGSVTIGVAKDPSATYAIISSLIIQGYSSAQTVFAPTGLLVTGTTRTTASIQWQDRSYSETGYQVWRATSSTGSYSLLANLPAGSTTYTDAGLTANTTYYYAVRTVYSGNTYSNYSNAVAATTCAYAVYINYTAQNNAPLPWNNTDQLIQNGYTWYNFFDETGSPTSTGMQITNQWGGLYSAGVNPGNNSGIFPDTVMIDSYGLFTGQTGTLQIQGLTFGMKYNFTFFGSSQAYGDVNTGYIINGVSTILNTSLNVNGTETIYGVTPDKNGNVNISVTAADMTSQFGLLGVLVIQSYAPSSASVPQPPQSAALKAAEKKNPADTNAPGASKQPAANPEISAYPNPFHDYFTLSLPDENNEDAVQVMIRDLSGKVVYSNQFAGLHSGTNIIKVETGSKLTSGIYIVEVMDANSNSRNTIKIEKQ